MLKTSQEERRQFMALAAAGAAALVAGCGTRAPLPGQAPASAGYRREAATHLYRKYPERIYRGKLPPMLYAIGVFEVELSQGGRVSATRWLRGPSHAPEVMAEIERLVRAAAPFPSPPGFGRVQYVDTWLWDRSGRFQLDTLSEGQL
ncbi:MAG: twin-arginine translocation signal domain-containing protein [Hydrogenophaga sp.]|uniref:twin-arginine translocation signal domain-containing protein n=1 Tax=Hydrogenophaga sp. TaxID=1904254 RepID=UPI002AB7F684|nr:twin-arginine translocation signal domain-containing protein [Hydrogenophaga sp.]MDZ4103629.1 twin-arginine translocation signal domain-containing protein [Hydrogenophaga sp.]